MKNEMEIIFAGKLLLNVLFAGIALIALQVTDELTKLFADSTTETAVKILLVVYMILKLFIDYRATQMNKKKEEK